MGDKLTDLDFMLGWFDFSLVFNENSQINLANIT